MLIFWDIVTLHEVNLSTDKQEKQAQLSLTHYFNLIPQRWLIFNSYLGLSALNFHSDWNKSIINNYLYDSHYRIEFEVLKIINSISHLTSLTNHFIPWTNEAFSLGTLLFSGLWCNYIKLILYYCKMSLQYCKHEVLDVQKVFTLNSTTWCECFFQASPPNCFAML